MRPPGCFLSSRRGVTTRRIDRRLLNAILRLACPQFNSLASQAGHELNLLRATDSGRASRGRDLVSRRETLIEKSRGSEVAEASMSAKLRNRSHDSRAIPAGGRLK